MKTNSAVILIAGLCGLGAFAQDKGRGPDLEGSVNCFFPDDDETYDSGWGAEVQARFWMNGNVGVALAVGGSAWEIKERGETVVYNGSGVSATLDGDVEMLPVGGSILFRPLENGNISFTVEAGVRYVVLDSEAVLDARAIAPGEDLVLFHDTVDIEDGVVGLVGANIEGRVGERAFLLLGAGYQFDLDEGQATWEGQDLGENSLAAVFIRGGFGVKW